MKWANFLCSRVNWKWLKDTFAGRPCVILDESTILSELLTLSSSKVICNAWAQSFFTSSSWHRSLPHLYSIAPNIWKWCKSQTFIVVFLEWLGTQTDFTAPPHYLPCSALLFPYRNSSYSVSVRQIPHILSFIRSCHLEDPPKVCIYLNKTE